MKFTANLGHLDGLCQERLTRSYGDVFSRRFPGAIESVVIAKYGIPKGKKHGTRNSYLGIHPWLLPGIGAQSTKNYGIIAFPTP
jgi:hypothetical protein